MGALCCCLRVEDIEEYVNPNSSFFRTCICLECFLNAYTTLFRGGRMQAIPSSIESTGTSSSPTSHDNSLPDIYRSPPRPLPYDADPRSFRSQMNLVLSRHEKGSTHLHEESELLQRSDSEANQECVHKGDKWNDIEESGSKEGQSESSMKHSLEMVSRGVDYVYASSEDEDVCPTCLEEYTPENPRIMTQCSHHYHLVCIYEWMERSESCPVCGKVMVFNETA